MSSDESGLNQPKDAPKTILLVDDVFEEIRVLQIHLKRQGWQTLYTSSGEDALNIIKANPPELMISDWDMPGMTGHELMEKVNDSPENRDIPFLLAHYDWPMGMWSRPTKNGRTADCHLVKPLNLIETHSLLSRILNASDRLNIYELFSPIWELIDKGNEKAFNRLMVLTKDPRIQVRSYAAHNLGRLKDRRVVHPLLQMMSKPGQESVVDGFACAALIELGAIAIPILIDVIRTGSQEDRDNAVYILGLTDYQNNSYLTSLLTHVDEKVRNAAMEAIVGGSNIHMLRLVYVVLPSFVQHEGIELPKAFWTMRAADEEAQRLNKLNNTDSDISYEFRAAYLIDEPKETEN